MAKKILFIAILLFLKHTYAQVGIGTTNPNGSAQLELLSSDKGLLIPRLELTSSTDISTITNGNVESLLIYNTVAVSDVTQGFYYWSGSKWEKIVTTSVVENLISSGGLNGLSAFEVWQSQAGNAGKTISEYFNSLKGSDGLTGIQGIQGVQGLPGLDGASVQIKGSVAGVADLPVAGNTKGDGQITKDDGHLHVWDGTSWIDVGLVKGPKGDQGLQGVVGLQGVQGIQGLSGLDGSSVQIKGSVADVVDLPVAGNTKGDGQITKDNGHLHVWDGASWIDVGLVKGPKGDTGLQGVQGIKGESVVVTDNLLSISSTNALSANQGKILKSAVDALTELEDGKVYLGNGSNNAVEVRISGDATIANTGVLTVTNNAITTEKINSGGTDKVLVTDNVGAVAWIDKAAFISKINVDAITIEGLGTLANPYKVKDLGIITAKLADDAVTTVKIVDSAITTEKINSGGIDKVLVTDNLGTVSWIDKAAFISKINVDAITIEGLGTLANPYKVKDLGIVTAKLADDAVTTVKILDGAITTEKINSGGTDKVLVTDNLGAVSWIDKAAFIKVDAITIEGLGTLANPYKVKDLGIVTAKLADDAVTTVKILDGAVTKTKLITATTAADNGKVLGIKSDGSGLEWKSYSNVILYVDDFSEVSSTPAAHILTKTALDATASNFKVSLNGSVVSPDHVAYNATDNTIKLTGIALYQYDVVTVVYTINK